MKGATLLQHGWKEEKGALNVHLQTQVGEKQNRGDVATHRRGLSRRVGNGVTICTCRWKAVAIQFAVPEDRMASGTA